MNRSDNQPRGHRDVPRQPNQWQEGPSSQPGGHREDEREARLRAEAERRYLEDPRNASPDAVWGGAPAAAPLGDTPAAPAPAQYPVHRYDPSGGIRTGEFTSEDYGGRDFYAGSTGFSGGMTPSNSYRPSYGFEAWGLASRQQYGREYGDWREYGERRGFFERAGDEIASWFGNHEAAHRRELDHAEDHRGKGPSDYTRSDERIREDVNDSLTHDRLLDASRIRVVVKDAEVTLDGKVDSRADKRRAEDLADSVPGVGHVQNNLRIDRGLRNPGAPTQGTASGSTGGGPTGL